MVQAAAYRFGEWLVEPALNRLSKNGAELQLEAKTMEVLAHLIEHTERVVPADELLDHAWEGAAMEQSTVHRRIDQIRKALGDDAKSPTYIQTIERRGYRAIAPIEPVTPAAKSIDAASLAGITPPFMAYEGDGPFAFACYSHRNRPAVYAELTRLQSEGVDIWYDEGIQPGQEWTADIARALNDCAQFIFFVTPDSVHSEHCRRELNFAQSRKKPITVIYLEPTELPDQLELQIGLTQAIHRYALDDETYYRKTDAALRANRSATRPTAWRWGALACLGLAIAIGLTWWALDAGRPAPSGDGTVHVAVLPFANMSDDPSKNYLGDAMAEEVWQRVSGEAALRAIAMTSARAAVAQKLDVQQIADALGVRYLVEGGVNRVGDEARVNVRVIDARHGGEIWSDRFERNVGTVDGTFDLYDDIAADVASAFDLVLSPGSSVDRPRPANVAAYNFCEQAFYNFRAGLLDQVEPLIDRALEADPEYARAHTMKGWWVRNKTERREIRPAAVGYQQARDHIERALALDPNSGSAYVQLGGMHLRMERDFRLAMQAFERAEALGVELAFLASDKAALLFLAGRYEDALALIEAATANDPLYLPLRVEAVPLLDALGRHADARALMDELIDLAPHDVRWVRYAVRHAAQQGDLDRARALMVDGVDWSGDLAYIELREGNPERFAELVERWSKDPSAHPLALANAFWFLEDYDAHLRWFTAALEEGVSLHVLPLELRRKGDYWTVLNDWALSDRTLAKQRLDRIAAHRARIDRATARMVL